MIRRAAFLVLSGCLAIGAPASSPAPPSGDAPSPRPPADTTRRVNLGFPPPRPSAAVEAPVPGPKHFSLLATSDTRGAVAPCG
jgi:hypothetical protein